MTGNYGTVTLDLSTLGHNIEYSTHNNNIECLIGSAAVPWPVINNKYLLQQSTDAAFFSLGLIYV